ncbi:DJ-1/PfpI family protein [Saccharopolyspora sp. NFXS83]|uniref:DJ-1/PfpI family protein n=1 Tax=Saccharopolyspora sp. NFXS83 TaxID=2993560 RepID=UPI00224AA7EA|nr:DJ-1/PfpI family protein [Saccharopolyspora sp. NFXS83]MCX2730512.1 DJ-1/PfpI family protein [Saccharopolyspora sp. NFXS83]
MTDTPIPALDADAPTRTVAMLVFDGMALLDLVGPQTVFTAAGMQVSLVAVAPGPVRCDTGVRIEPTTTTAECPAEVDVLFVPGGDVSGVMADETALAFLADRGATAGYVTSVCTGSMVLAAAGLLDGHRAATHWSTRDLLGGLGVEVSAERVCADGNRITGGGVTAGIDFGLTLVARMFGDATAEFAQLVLEYDPAPPFDAGTPERAKPEHVAWIREFLTSPDSELVAAVERARRPVG